jgi:hypothetical protein
MAWNTRGVTWTLKDQALQAADKQLEEGWQELFNI